MSRKSLGEFEFLVLLALLRLGDGTYGVPIIQEIERRTGRSVAPAAVYVALQRLEKKGLITTWLSDPQPERRGKPRRHIRIRPEAIELLKESHRTFTRMWAGLEPILEER